jgi:TonB family protein
MKALCIVLLASLSLVAYAQDSTVYFFDKYGQKTIEPEEAYTYRIIVPKGELLHIRQFNASNDKLVVEGTFSKLGLTMEPEGPYRSFYQNGQLQSQGTYSKGKKIDLWREYYADGQQADEQFHRHDDKIVYHQHWDTAGKPMLTNGTGKFTKGAQHAEVIDSILFSLFTIDSLSGDSVYIVVEENATYTGGMDAFYDAIQRDLRYPKLAKEFLVQGKVYVEFVVDKSGKLQGARVIEGLGGGCDEAALDALKKRRQWTPGKVRNKVVNQKMVLPIAFKL